MADSDRDEELYQAMRDFALRVLKGTRDPNEIAALPLILKYLLPRGEM